MNIEKLIIALNRIALVANALNPKDPMYPDQAHRALWDALKEVSDKWPIKVEEEWQER